MDNIVEKVKEEMIQISNEKMKETKYDDWNNHIKLVYENGHKLALERLKNLLRINQNLTFINYHLMEKKNIKIDMKI